MMGKGSTRRKAQISAREEEIRYSLALDRLTSEQETKLKNELSILVERRTTEALEKSQVRKTLWT